MAYCVQCGVELTTGTPACPLCHTRVLHPDALDASTPEQPEHVETAIDRIDRVYGRRLSIALLLVPMLTVTLLDFIGGGGLTWSPYVTGALICLYCWFVVPVFYKFSRPYMYIAVDTLALCSYLLLIALINDGISWFVGLALPVVMAVGLFVLGIFWAFRRIQSPMLKRVSLGLTILGLFLLALEVLTDLWINKTVFINWSIFAVIPLMVISLMCLYFERNEPLKKEIRKRLFL